VLFPCLIAWHGSNGVWHRRESGVIMLETSSGVQEAVGSMQTLAGRVHPTANKPLRIPAVRLDGTDKPTVWSEFGELASQTHAVNLGQAREAESV